MGLQVVELKPDLTQHGLLNMAWGRGEMGRPWGRKLYGGFIMDEKSGERDMANYGV
jgi:hypothetical protein